MSFLNSILDFRGSGAKNQRLSRASGVTLTITNYKAFQLPNLLWLEFYLIFFLTEFNLDLFDKKERIVITLSAIGTMDESPKESIKKEPKKGLFNRKSKPVEENLTVQKKGLFGRKKEVIKEEIKPKKKGWFK